MSKIIMTIFFVMNLGPHGEKMLATIQHWLCTLGFVVQHISARARAWQAVMPLTPWLRFSADSQGRSGNRDPDFAQIPCSATWRRSDERVDRRRIGHSRPQ